MMVISKPISKVENCLNQLFLFARIKSIPVSHVLKRVFDLIKLVRFKDCINDANIALFGC